MITVDPQNLHDLFPCSPVQVLAMPCYQLRKEVVVTEIHEKYEIPPEIEAELASLPSPTAASYLRQLLCASIEVVVIARRQSTDRRLRDQIDSILVERTAARILTAVHRHSGAPPEEMDEAGDEAMLLFWEAIQRESFFEVRFNRALQYLAKRAGRNIRGGMQRGRERSALRIGSKGDEDADAQPAPIDIVDNVDSYSQLEDQLLVQSGLASLPDEQAKALCLHYLLGLPIFVNEPTVPTVASELGCGERKARKLIADGKAALRRSIGQEDVDE